MGSVASNAAGQSNHQTHNLRGAGMGGNSSNSSSGGPNNNRRNPLPSLPASRGRRGRAQSGAQPLSSANAAGTTQPLSSAPAGTGSSLSGIAESSPSRSAAVTNLSLSRPYSINNRVATDDTQLLRVPSISRNSTNVTGALVMTDGKAKAANAADAIAANISVAAPAPAPTSALTPSLPPSDSSAGNNAGVNNPRGHRSSASSAQNIHPSHPPVTKPNAVNVVSQPVLPSHCLNPASEINSRLDTQVEVRVYPCNNSQAGSTKKKFTQFNVKPEGVIIQGTNRHRAASNDLGAEYAMHIGRKLQRYELSDTRACQLLVTTHNKSFWVVPAPEAFSRHSGTCRLLGDRKHQTAPHTLQVGDFLRVGSVGVVVIETHDGTENRILSEEKIQKIMKDTTSNSGGFLDLAETDGENSDDSSQEESSHPNLSGDAPVCYMCFDEEDTDENPMITPCKCLGDTRYVHVDCLRKWHTAEADNQICFLSSVDATCSVCKSTFRSDFKLKDGRLVKLFKSSLEPPYVSLLVATKHEMAQRLFNTRFQLSFSTLLKPDGRNGTRPLHLGRSSGSDMVLDYRTVSARHAAIRFKNGEFVFTDAGSSNGSYLYLRRPVELTPSQSVQFRLGRSMISMKVVNKWNRRLLRAVSRRAGLSGSSNGASSGDGDDHSVGSNDDDVRITDNNGSVTRTLPRRTREHIMDSMPPLGTLSQNSPHHLDLLYALAYPKRVLSDKDGKRVKPNPNPVLRPSSEPSGENAESKQEDLSEMHVSRGPLENVTEGFEDMALDGAEAANQDNKPSTGLIGRAETNAEREESGENNVSSLESSTSLAGN